MTTFVELGEKTYNVGRIVWFKARPNKNAKPDASEWERYTTEVMLDNGEQLTIKGNAEHQIMRASQPVFPAGPGWFVLYLDDGEVWRDAIIGWRVSSYDSLEPMTLDYADNGNRHKLGGTTILDPMGHVTTDDQRWVSENEWVAEVKRDRLKKAMGG